MMMSDTHTPFGPPNRQRISRWFVVPPSAGRRGGERVHGSFRLKAVLRTIASLMFLLAGPWLPIVAAADEELLEELKHVPYKIVYETR